MTWSLCYGILSRSLTPTRSCSRLLSNVRILGLDSLNLLLDRIETLGACQRLNLQRVVLWLLG